MVRELLILKYAYLDTMRMRIALKNRLQKGEEFSMKNRLKKGIAYILTTVLAISVIPHLPKSIVQAAGSQGRPGITSYATKERKLLQICGGGL